MKTVSPPNKLSDILCWIIIFIIAVVPFHAFLTVWAASNFGHYTLWRLWDELLLALLVFGALYLLLTERPLRARLARQKIFWLIFAYALIQLIWGVAALASHHVSLKALGYAWIVNLRFLVFFLAVWLVAAKTARLGRSWPKLLLIPAAVVVAFGLLQAFILPHNFLVHFGYGPHTIAPYETINHNARYVRIESTLRGANPLGSYLVLVVSALGGFLLAARRKARTAGFLLVALIVLFFSFSRSAWLGAALSLLTILWLGLKSKRAQQWLGLGLLGLAILAFVGALALRHNARFENYVLHTQTHSAIKTTSNSGHLSALASGLRQVGRNPLGQGPGTAGPASVYNNHPARIAEDYYVQVAQETGWLGLLIFLAILAETGRLLWRQRIENLALIMLAALLGLSLVNLLSYGWSDDTLAYVFWGLAALAVGTAVPLRRTSVAT